MPNLAETTPAGLPHDLRARGNQAETLRLIASRALVAVIARKGQAQSLAAAVKRTFGIDLPHKPRLTRGQAVSFLWAGHQHWLALADQRNDLLSVLHAELGTVASLCDQSDSRVILELSGPSARQSLAKLVPIDLHPHVFRTNDTALTLFGHIAGQITQSDDTPTYELMAPRSFAESFIHDVVGAVGAPALA